MTIASEITRIKTNINNAYTALEAKGATIPSEKNSANLASTVNTITTGGGSSGETNYLGRIVTEDGVLQFPEESFSFSLPDDVTSIGDYSLQYAFASCINLTSTGLNNVTYIGDYGLHYAFASCINLTSTGLNNVTSIGDYGLQYAFMGCTNLTSTGLNNMMTIGESSLRGAFQSCTNLTSTGLENVNRIGNGGLDFAFRDCTNLTSTGLENVTYIGGGGLDHAFQGCTNLTSIGLNNFKSMGGRALQYAFSDCTSLTSLSFPALNSNSFGSSTIQFNNMLSGVTGCTVHFPSNLESVIGDWSSVTSGFGGTNTTVLFDLPATT